MTYGWAILIIAVVLGVFFQLGVFSNIGTPRARPGNCQIIRADSGITQTISLEGECQGQLPEYVVQFNGKSSSYISAGTSGLPISSKAFSIFMWAYPTSFADEPTYIAYGNPASSTLGSDAEIFLDTTGLLWFQYSCCADVSSGFMMPLNKWSFIGVTYISGSTATVYYNGAEAVVSVPPMNIILSPANLLPLVIGNQGGKSPPLGYSMIGDLANIQIYNASLSQAEVNALYQEGIGGAPIRPQNIAGWWPLNGNLNDYSGNNNNGQATGIIYSSSWMNGYTQP